MVALNNFFVFFTEIKKIRVGPNLYRKPLSSFVPIKKLSGIGQYMTMCTSQLVEFLWKEGSNHNELQNSGPSFFYSIVFY